ncbi:MAG: hypothetical protein HDS78_09200 [Bacteroidales bacterium]|nr:hypothetical protein [Bacteroidales bacterium]MDE6436881.1 lipopolysaccharide kinase InaA family protein [Muribaculaceae bacterium]
MKATIRTVEDISPAARQLAEQLATTGDVSALEQIYSGRNRLFRTPDGKLCVKAYRVPGFIKRFIYGFLRKSKAFRAFDNARELKELAIPTPAAVAAVECKNFGFLGRTYYICEYADGWQELRGVEKRSDFPALSRALAEFIYKLHRNGVLMKDLSPGNVLWRLNGSYFDFTLVDINRMEFDIEDRDLLLSNFGAPLDTEDAVRQLGKQYALLCSTPALENEIMDIFRNRQKELWRKRHIKEFFRGKKK